MSFCVWCSFGVVVGRVVDYESHELQYVRFATLKVQCIIILS